MDISAIIGLLGGVLGLIGGITGILSWINQRKQTQLIQQQVRAVLIQDERYAEWTRKQEQAMDALTKICVGTVNTGRGMHAALAVVFPDKDFRERIERHLGHSKGFWSKFEPTKLSKEQLLNPVVQQVIQDVLDTVEKFKAEHMDWARAIKLLPPR
jgi:hypothetical protein